MGFDVCFLPRSRLEPENDKQKGERKWEDH